MKLTGKILVTIIVCTFSLSNCQKPSYEHRVRNTVVNISFSTNLAQYTDLNFVGGWLYLKGGSNGILVYRASQEDMKAYDRQAPYQVVNECQVIVDSNSTTTCSDTCSGSQWLLLDGQIIKGPASLPLKAYNVSFDGENVTITN